MIVAMASQRSSTVLAATFRSRALSPENDIPNDIPMGFKSGLWGGRSSSLVQAASMAWRTPAASWAGRLSITTISPGLNSGTGTCSTQVRKAVPFIGPSRNIGAAIPPNRRPAVKVPVVKMVVFQCPCGTGWGSFWMSASGSQ